MCKQVEKDTTKAFDGYDTFEDYLRATSMDIHVSSGLSVVERLNFIRANFMSELVETTPGNKEYVLINNFGEPIHLWPVNVSKADIAAELKKSGWLPHDGKSDKYVHSKLAELLVPTYLEMRDTTTCRDRFLGKDAPYSYYHVPKATPDLPDAELGYVRFGDVPADGHSLSPFSTTPEDGVSCFEAEITAPGDYKFINLTCTLCESAMRFLAEGGRPIYRLYGDVVGYGWDGEPLLHVTKCEQLTGSHIGSLEDARVAAAKEELMAM